MRIPMTGGGRVYGAMALLVSMYVVAFGLAVNGGTAAAGPAPETLSWGVPSPLTSRSAAAGQEGQAGQGQPAEPAEVVGDETCTTCHVDMGEALDRTMHGNVRHPRTPAATGTACETCHGPGSVHIEDPSVPGSIRNFATMAPRESSDTCASCHNRGEHAEWAGSTHDARNLSCVSCHSVHSPKSEEGQLRQATVGATCAQCHRDKFAKLQRAAHMPVREGKMECITCHSPHGSTNVRMLRAGNTINESCTSCHTEKRGPFLFDHPPVQESCATCHDPHGSSNDRMLVAKPPMLCQRCHIAVRHPSTLYDNTQFANQSLRVVSRACVNCHSNIHGSNHPSGSMFVR